MPDRRLSWRVVHLVAAAAAVLAGTAATAHAQRDTTARDTTLRDTVAYRLPPVVTVTRDVGRSPLDLPYAITVTRPDSLRPGQRHTQLEETLLLVPGVTVANRNNPTQDPRVSIRGFGARSAFGVRGVRVMRDGMPLTLPDGQTPVDYMDLELVGSTEVIRGSASALYGNASGGVIDLRTRPAPGDALAGQVRGWGGSYGWRRWTGVAGGTYGPFTYQGDINRTTTDGYRDYSHQQVTSGYARGGFSSGNTDYMVQLLGYDMPTAENPGALTKALLDSAPRAADPQSVLRKASKASTQYQLGVQATHHLNAGELVGSIYGGTRTLDNPLTFAIVGFDRKSYGGTFRGTVVRRLFGVDHRFTAGTDLQRQDDDRKNWANCNGLSAPPAPTSPCFGATGPKGALSLDQTELVSSIGPYLRDELAFGDRWRLSLGAREDIIKFQLKDHFFDDGRDDSGSRTMHRFSPMGGVDVRLTPLHAAYANIATAFETPTTTELVNHPDGSAGLNPDLDPQISTTYEVGMKGVLLSRVQYDAAVYQTNVRDELIQYQVPGGEGRTFYRNAGRTRRRGFEVGLFTTVGPVDLGASYTFANYRFTEFKVANGNDTTNYAGNTIPGIPKNQLEASATYRYRNAFATAEVISNSSQFVNDPNNARADGFTLVNLRLGGVAAFGRPWLSPVLGIQNLFDTKYVGSVAVNASTNPTTGKFYEPGVGRTVFFGLTVAAGR